MLSSDENYYKAYDKRYKQVYENGMLWTSKENTKDIMEVIEKYHISNKSKILDLGCGEGRDAIYLLNNGYNVLGVDYSYIVVQKCNELSKFQYMDKFRQLDLVCDKLDDKFDFIYSVAVLHMFITDSHRKQFLNFIRNHLSFGGIALICVMGDGKKNFTSDYTKAFDDTKRVVMNNKKKLNLATTSCRIVDWDTLIKEINSNNLQVIEKWISNSIPEFSEMMCVVVSL